MTRMYLNICQDVILHLCADVSIYVGIWYFGKCLNSDILAYICGGYVCIHELSVYLPECRYYLNSDIGYHLVKGMN